MKFSAPHLETEPEYSALRIGLKSPHLPTLFDDDDDVDDDVDDVVDDDDDDDAPPDRPRASSSSSSPRPRRAVVPSVESSKPDATNNSLCSRRDRFDWFEKNASSALNVNKNAAKNARNRARRNVLRSLVVVRIASEEEIPLVGVVVAGVLLQRALLSRDIFVMHIRE